MSFGVSFVDFTKPDSNANTKAIKSGVAIFLIGFGFGELLFLFTQHRANCQSKKFD